jgi:hypothetical protein
MRRALGTEVRRDATVRKYGGNSVRGYWKTRLQEPLKMPHRFVSLVVRGASETPDIQRVYENSSFHALPILGRWFKESGAFQYPC